MKLANVVFTIALKRAETLKNEFGPDVHLLFWQYKHSFLNPDFRFISSEIKIIQIAFGVNITANLHGR